MSRLLHDERIPAALLTIVWLCCCKTSVAHSSGGIRSSGQLSNRSTQHAKSSVTIMYCKMPSRRPTEIHSSAWPWRVSEADHDAGKSLPLPRHGRGIRAKDQRTHPGD